MLTREQLQKSSFKLIKQEDDKFFSKLLSKETADSSSSFRVYHDGLSGSVPFFWESRPGTPKHPLDQLLTVPPLTPPPSYHHKSSYTNRSSSSSKKLLSSKSNLLRILFLKARGKKSAGANKPGAGCQSTPHGYDNTVVFPPLMTTSTTPENKLTTSTMSENKLREQRRLSSRGSSSSSDWSLNDGDQGLDGLPVSTLCFGAMRSASAWHHRLIGSIYRTRSCAP